MDKSRHDISHQQRATNDGILNLLSNLEPKALYLDSWFRRYSMSLKPKLYSNPSAFLLQIPLSSSNKTPEYLLGFVL